MQKKALITGITSQDGAYLSQYLLKKGYKVVGLIRSSQNPYFNGLKYLGIDSEIEYEIGDLLDGIGLNRILYKHNFDEIYNLAAQSSVNISFQQPLSTMQFNCMSTLNLLEIIRILDQGTKFLLPVSSEMYGHNL